MDDGTWATLKLRWVLERIAKNLEAEALALGEAAKVLRGKV